MAAYVMHELNGFRLDPPSPEAGDTYFRSIARGDDEVADIAAVLTGWASPLG